MLSLSISEMKIGSSPPSHLDRSRLVCFRSLLMFVDVPDALACALTVDVKEWWSAEDLAVTAPGGTLHGHPTFARHRRRDGSAGTVPVYFVNLLEYVDAIGDGVLTVAELESLPSLLIGHATTYQYVQLNSGGELPSDHA